MDEIIQNPAINEFLQKYDQRDWNQVIIKLCLISLGFLNSNNPKPLYSFDELDEVLLNFQNENNQIPSSQENNNLNQYESNNNKSNIWICKNCGNKNFGFILNCNKCGQSKNPSNITFGQVNNQPNNYSFIRNNSNPLIDSNNSNPTLNIKKRRTQLSNNIEMNPNEYNQNNINLNNNNLNDNEMNNDNLNDYNSNDNENINDNMNSNDINDNPLNNPEYDDNNNNNNFNNENPQSLDYLSQSNDYTFPEYINYLCRVICCEKCYCNPCCCIYRNIYCLNNKNYNYESSSYNMSSHIINNDNNYSGRQPCPNCH